MIVRFQLAQISILDRKCQIRGKFISLRLTPLHPAGAPGCNGRRDIKTCDEYEQLNRKLSNYHSNCGPALPCYTNRKYVLGVVLILSRGLSFKLTDK